MTDIQDREDFGIEILDSDEAEAEEDLLELARRDAAIVLNGKDYETLGDGNLLERSTGRILTPEGEVIDTFMEPGLPESLETQNDVDRVMNAIFNSEIQARGCEAMIQLYTENMRKLQARHLGKAAYIRFRFGNQLESYLDQVLPAKARVKSLQFGFGTIGRERKRKIWGMKKGLTADEKVRAYELVNQVHANLNSEGQAPIVVEQKPETKFLKSNLIEEERGYLLDAAPDLFEETGGTDEFVLETGAGGLPMTIFTKKTPPRLEKPPAPRAIAAKPEVRPAPVDLEDLPDLEDPPAVPGASNGGEEEGWE